MASTRRVWYVVVDGEGKEYKETGASSVNISLDDTIARFAKAVFAGNSNILRGIVPSQLLVYSNKEAFARKDERLGAGTQIGEELGKDDELCVVVPLAQVPQVRPSPPSHGIVNCVLPFSDGVNPLGMNFDRQEVLDKMHKWITDVEGRNRFLMIDSPAASGKTSLLILFQHKYRNNNLVIPYITIRGKGDPWQKFIQFVRERLAHLPT